VRRLPRRPRVRISAVAHLGGGRERDGAGSKIYEELSAALGVRYERVAASLDGKCSREQWLKCNVTAPIPGVVAAVRSAAAEVARGS